MSKLFKEIQAYVDGLEFSIISAERKSSLLKLSSYIRKELQSKNEVRLNFICTHNSRRSQLCELWVNVAAFHFGLGQIQVASGGTEATALHHNIVMSLKKCGFQISESGNRENDGFLISFSEIIDPLNLYSKLYTESFENNRTYAVIMTCEDAEDNCPYIPEASERFSLTYTDPKIADGTNRETQIYSDCNRQIATEMFYLLSEVSNS